MILPNDKAQPQGQLQFANLLGDPVDTTPPGKAPKATKRKSRRVYDAQAATEFHGFVVTGFSPEMISKARQASEYQGRAFDEAMYLRNAKPANLSPRPYALRQAADQFAAIATKAGHKGVKVEPILRSAL